MMTSTKSLLIFTLLSFSSVSFAHDTIQIFSTPQNAIRNSSGYDGCFSKVFAFGDSSTDTGNAHLLGVLKPFAGASSPSFPNNSTTSGHRLSNGRLVIDFLSEALNLPPFPTYKDIFATTGLNASSGVNFAIAGSTALSSDFNVFPEITSNLMWESTPVTFQTQIDWFGKYLMDVHCKGKNESNCRADLEDALFWFGPIGVDDYSRILGSSVSYRWLSEMSISYVSRLLTILLDRGARYIVVQGLPPIGCFPSAISQSIAFDCNQMGCASSINSAVTTYNYLLQRRLSEFQKTYDNSLILYADYYNAYMTALQNLEKYEMEEPFKTCCGAGGGPLNFDLHCLCGARGSSVCKNSDQYIHWDGVHLTESMNQNLADLFLHQGFCQPSFAELINKKRGTQRARE